MDINFFPSLWTEDKLPIEAKIYEKCEVYTEKSRIIWGEGNPKGSIFIILDNPGARENKEGKEYVCKTRETLQKVLYQTDIKAEDVYITYLLKCRPLKKYDKEKARNFSLPFLLNQIEEIKPKFLVCLGDIVTKVMFKDKEVSVKDLRGTWHALNGLPAMVSYHPLAVSRRPNLSKFFKANFLMLANKYYKNDVTN